MEIILAHRQFFRLNYSFGRLVIIIAFSCNDSYLTYQSFFIWKSFGALCASLPCLRDDVVVILPGVIVVLGVTHEGEGAVVALLSRVIVHLDLDRQQQQQKTKRFSKINFIFK
jgi:hypothetical protein